MTFLPKTIDVYIQPSEIFTPISEELTTYIRKLHKKVSVPRLRAVEDLLKKTYKIAPATVKTLTADNVKVIKKLIKSFEKLRDADNPQKEKKYQEAIYETLPSFLSDLALIAKEIKIFADKEEGHYYENLSNEYEITVSAYDLTGNPVEFIRNPVIVSLPRPLPENSMDEKCEPRQLELLLYVLNKAKLVGVFPQDIAPKFTEERVQMFLYKHTGKKFNLVPFRLKHATSKRVWYLIDELGVQYKSVQFADRQLVTDNHFVQSILHETDTAKIIQILTKNGFGVNDAVELALRLGSTEDNTTRHHILTTEILYHQRKVKMESLKRKRLAFEHSQEELSYTLKLLEDDYQKSKEDMVNMKDRFKVLTSQDADTDTGLSISSYKNIDKHFLSLQRTQIKFAVDDAEKEHIRKSMRETRLEARTLFYLLKEETKTNKKRLKTINRLKTRLENRKIRSFELMKAK